MTKDELPRGSESADLSAGAIRLQDIPMRIVRRRRSSTSTTFSLPRTLATTPCNATVRGITAKPRESAGLSPQKCATVAAAPAPPAAPPLPANAKEVEALKLKADSAEQAAKASKELAQKALQYVLVWARRHRHACIISSLLFFFNPPKKGRGGGQNGKRRSSPWRSNAWRTICCRPPPPIKGWPKCSSGWWQPSARLSPG